MGRSLESLNQGRSRSSSRPGQSLTGQLTRVAATFEDFSLDLYRALLLATHWLSPLRRDLQVESPSLALLPRPVDFAL